MSKEFWNERFSEAEFTYGEEPNDFLREVADRLPANAHVLCLAEGQGRNAVWLAEQGHRAVAVDQAEEGLKRAHELAARRGVTIETIVADLSDWTPPGEYDAIVAIFAHLPVPARAQMHSRAAAALKPGGFAIIEGYTPRQLEYKTGGPQAVELLIEPETLRGEFEGFEFLRLEERVREISEGAYHRGTSAVVQLLAKKSE